ncbi:hypothetical protein LJC49_09540, partial [Ruminococcaceae bacterium OttesenSCG-928-I18]|nr:hypothetical protein [Ruminococcaceae bacterium OttesenSCG-928-I18]
ATLILLQFLSYTHKGNPNTFFIKVKVGIEAVPVSLSELVFQNSKNFHYLDVSIWPKTNEWICMWSSCEGFGIRGVFTCELPF